MHQQLLNHYYARIRNDGISDDDDNNNGFNNQGQRTTGDSNRELAPVPGRDNQTSAVLKTPDRDLKADGGMSAENDRRGLGRNGSNSSSSDAAGHPHFETITQGEACADTKGLERAAPEIYVWDVRSASFAR